MPPSQPTHRLQITLHIPNIPTPRAPWVPCRLLNHVLVQALLVEHAPVHNLEALDLRALLEDVHRGRGHRPGEDAADIGVVAARGGEEDDLVRGGVEDGRDDGNVGQVRAAGVRGVGHEDVAFFHGGAV